MQNSSIKVDPLLLPSSMPQLVNITREQVLQAIQQHRQIDETQILNIYIFGSLVYGTAAIPKSNFIKREIAHENQFNLNPNASLQDYDMYVVLAEEVVGKDLSQLEAPVTISSSASFSSAVLLDITFLKQSEFEAQIKEYHLTAIECISYHYHSDLAQFILLEKKVYDQKVTMPVDPDAKNELRRFWERRADHAMAKAKKKLELEPELHYLSMKNIFHALRMLQFSEQVARLGYVVDFQCANTLYKSIFQDYEEYFVQKQQREAESEAATTTATGAPGGEVVPALPSFTKAENVPLWNMLEKKYRKVFKKHLSALKKHLPRPIVHLQQQQ